MIKYDSKSYYTSIDRKPHHQVFLHRQFCQQIPEEDASKVASICCGDKLSQMVPNDEIMEYLDQQGIDFVVELTWGDACAILLLNYKESDLVALKLRYGFSETCI